MAALEVVAVVLVLLLARGPTCRNMVMAMDMGMRCCKGDVCFKTSVIELPTNDSMDFGDIMEIPYA
eukprot:CAMPEP_0197837752 /NCGR_PEP_ID=MMETSP1437-20131217/33196_1 /TAXON_ID=49252 ORGANISM="Eucampia antarctica, Strain CCMP1452" /NCGR_SAMPLE_ID=MMETSP1437 /ASSEMBLY_ACC=CAM_ASM_001096 /LENGTH=65 /DNA_ID=CAMNT_0043445073 /DNA_START=322 /DNA_END=516 /DNA_ORIENTATION=+